MAEAVIIKPNISKEEEESVFKGIADALSSIYEEETGIKVKYEITRK